MSKAAAPPTPMLSGWGRVPAPGSELLSEHLESATRGAQLSRGLGRSYGDSSLPATAADKVVGTRLANRILAFDPGTGVIRVEAGLSLAELNRLFMPRGWFTPVSPGTQFVTLGGMVSSDIHGGSHHVAGCFGQHVRALKVRLASDDLVECSPSENDDLFYGVIGGMGLLGHVLEVEFTLEPIPSSWLLVDTEPVPNIEEFLSGLDRVAQQYPQTKGWIDCLNQGRSMGRGAIIAGRWATVAEAGTAEPSVPRGQTLPFDLPNWAVNNLTGRIFNSFIYWNFPRGRTRAIQPPSSFFYPLDAVLQWNRVFGSRGFTQHQCVLPRRAGAAAVREFMKLVTAIGTASPVCVIKDCGPEGRGVLSFPLAGTSIAIDMPLSSHIQRDVDRLNELVIAAGGRIYLAKDRFTRADHFRAMEPRLPKFLALREKWDPKRRLRSAQSVRVFGDRT
jgi:decaprenylphospho-beta-D-ribofuranose 2-oxidase